MACSFQLRLKEGSFYYIQSNLVIRTFCSLQNCCLKSNVLLCQLLSISAVSTIQGLNSFQIWHRVPPKLVGYITYLMKNQEKMALFLLIFDLMIPNAKFWHFLDWQKFLIQQQIYGIKGLVISKKFIKPSLFFIQQFFNFKFDCILNLILISRTTDPGITSTSTPFWRRKFLH